MREVGGDAAIYAEGGDYAGGRPPSHSADRERLVAAGLERAAALLLGRDGAADGRGLSEGARVKVSAIVVSHGHPRELELSLPALRPQVDELVVIANIPGSVPAGVDAVHNERPLGFAANVNQGVALTTGELVVSANPDAIPREGAVDGLRASWRRIRRAVSPGRRWSSPTARPSRRAAAFRR